MLCLQIHDHLCIVLFVGFHNYHINKSYFLETFSKTLKSFEVFKRISAVHPPAPSNRYDQHTFRLGDFETSQDANVPAGSSMMPIIISAFV